MKPPAQVEREVLLTYLSGWWKHSKLATLPAAPTVSDQGHGRDVVCPIVYYGQPFNPELITDLYQLSAYTFQELRGYDRFQVTVLDGDWMNETLPLNFTDQEWVLQSPDGAVAVFPQTEPAEGETVLFVIDEEVSFSASVAVSWLHGVGYLSINLHELECSKLEAGSNAPYEARVRVTIMIAAPHSLAPSLADQYAGAIARLFRKVRFKADPAAAAGVPEREMADSNVHRIYQSDRDPIEERPNHVGDVDNWAWYRTQIILRRLFTSPSRGVQPVTA